MSQLRIGVDVGFDHLKVIANGRAFKFPFNVVETDERKLTEYALRDDFLRYRGRLGTTYRGGQYAREHIFENITAVGDVMKEFYDEHRFVSEEFSVGLDVAIALAIEKNGLYHEQQSLDIRLIDALPHAYRSRFASTVVGRAAVEHRFSLKVGTGDEKEYCFTINSENVFTVSQTIAAILGETSDEYGNIDEAKAYYLTQGPTLVLDGGYYTFVIVAVSRGGSVDDNTINRRRIHGL